MVQVHVRPQTHVEGSRVCVCVCVCVCARRQYFFYEAGDFAQLLTDKLVSGWALGTRLRYQHTPTTSHGGAAPTTGTQSSSIEPGAGPTTAAEGVGLGGVGFAGSKQLAAALADALASCAAAARTDSVASALRATHAPAPPHAAGEDAAAVLVRAYGLGPHGIAHAFQLTCTLQWPLSEILGDSNNTQGMASDGNASNIASGGAAAHAGYTRVAGALMRMRLCSQALQRAWHAGRRAAPGGSRADARAACRAVQDALHFVSALQRHASRALSGMCWTRLQRNWTGAGAQDGRQLAAAHNRYLAHAKMGVFLPEPVSHTVITQSHVRGYGVLSESVRGALGQCEIVAALALELLCVDQDSKVCASAQARMECTQDITLRTTVWCILLLIRDTAHAQAIGK